MKFALILAATTILSLVAQAQEAAVDVSLTPAGSFTAKTSEIKGYAEQRADEVEAHDIVVGLKSIATGVDLRDEHTRKQLDVVKFPEAVLVSAKGKGGKGEGLIRIRGVEKKISGTYKMDGDHLVANFPLALSDFGIGGIRYMGVGVDDQVKLTVRVPIKKAAATTTAAKK
jgi:polyisoprenoid-binding protein YceI